LDSAQKGSSVWNSIRKLDAVPAYRADGDSALFGEVFGAHGLAADATDGNVLFGAEGLKADRTLWVLAVEHFGEVDTGAAALHTHRHDPPALDPAFDFFSVGVFQVCGK
jgi:hypothetical protein